MITTQLLLLLTLSYACMGNDSRKSHPLTVDVGQHKQHGHDSYYKTEQREQQSFEKNKNNFKQRHNEEQAHYIARNGEPSDIAHYRTEKKKDNYDHGNKRELKHPCDDQKWAENIYHNDEKLGENSISRKKPRENKKKNHQDIELINGKQGQDMLTMIDDEAQDERENKNKKVTIQHLPAFSAPPDHKNTVLMARYIVHTVDWAGIATQTSRETSEPFVNIISISDGTDDDGTGVPYFYVTPIDLTMQDIAKESRASIVVTLAQTDYCRNNSSTVLDQRHPACSTRLVLSGKIKRVKPESPEDEFARNALFTRHSAMRDWPKDHRSYLAKIKIGKLILLDQFEGRKYVDVKDYLNPQSERD